MGSRVELFEQIRRDREREGLSLRALAARHGVHRRTVRQALAAEVHKVLVEEGYRRSRSPRCSAGRCGLRSARRSEPRAERSPFRAPSEGARRPSPAVAARTCDPTPTSGRAQGAALLEALDANPDAVLPLRHELTKPGEAEALRGMPMLSKGVGGVMRGTSPLNALLAKESRKRDW
jgi:hypothetical protein